MTRVSAFEDTLDRLHQVFDEHVAGLKEDADYLHDIHEALAEAGHPTLACTPGPDGGNDGVTHVECVNALAQQRDAALAELDRAKEKTTRLAHQFRTLALDQAVGVARDEARGREAKLVLVLGELVDRVQYVSDSPEYEGVWALARLHSGPYTGPSFAAELQAAERVLAEHRKEQSDG